MAQIHGQIDSLKQIRNTLKLKGISRFNSVTQLNNFLINYKAEQKLIQESYENELVKDIEDLKQSLLYDQEVLKNIRKKSLRKLNQKIIANYNLQIRIKKENSNSYFEKIISNIVLKLMAMRYDYLIKNYDKTLKDSTNSVEKKIDKDHQILKKFILEKDTEVHLRSKKDINHLAQIKEVVHDLNPLIAGAIGENLVVKEISKLSDDYILINDFSLEFEKPIRYKKGNSWIQSIQIDHLLISKAGIFVLETKNWSKRSIQSEQLRSPVEQINRTSYALFVLLSRKNIKLKNHYWGENKEIPIRSIIVMINEKPKEKFKYVQIKTLKELNGYIEYFDPIFNDHELEKIHKEIVKLI